MKRLSIVALLTAAIFAVGITTYFVFAQGKHVHAQQLRANNDGGGPLDSATVTFGGWMMPLDRFPNNSPIVGNHHALTPKTVKIKAGGTVNFVIGGFHNVVVYDDGTQPTDINVNLTVPPTNQPGPPLINDPNRRIYRGLDPSLQSQGRVESIVFDRPGTYLAICAVRPHFVNDAMYGFVKVVPADGSEDNKQ